MEDELTLRGLDTEEYCGNLSPGSVDFVCRYYSRPGNPKNLTPQEAKAVSALGISIVSVFETSATRAIGASAADGVDDATLAIDQAHACGQPQGSAIYFAVDGDIADASQVHDYTAGFAATCRAAGYRVGVYGGGNVCAYLRGSGLVDFAWLSGALGFTGSRQYLAEGQWHIRQYVGNALGLEVGGLDIDADSGQGDDPQGIGAWRLAA